ncbi:MAG: T9SS type A sorting domain-containing protein [Chitinophagaceae bacterium]|nr:T9SS type A sorting domain-containing protein [Chitinophagaceae bacterium]
MTTFVKYPTLLKVCLAILLVFGLTGLLNAQGVSEIITDYNGYYKTGIGAVSTVKPDNNHNLLSFSFNGTRYSTGVNDALLTSHGETFTPSSFRALPLNNITGAPTGNTKIGLGALADGVPNGAGPAPSRNLGNYLNDGVNGLNLGTVVANLPAGTMFLSVSNLNAANIGDGVPDILVTQVADPSGADYYAFTDVNGNMIGNQVDVTLVNITPVGQWVADFYEATGGTILQPGFTQTQRDVRLWAADFSAFGINASNIGNIAYFRIVLSGNSDVAFVAYNTTTVTVQQVLSIPGQPAQRISRGVNREQETSLKLFPNPAVSSANLVHPKSKGEESIFIYSGNGVLLGHQKVSRNTTQSQLNIAGLSKGAYHVVYDDGLSKRTQKLIIQ